MGRIESFEVNAVKISVFLPDSYIPESTRRFPLLLMLNSGFKAHDSVAQLNCEGVLPEMVVAEIATAHESLTPDPIAILGALNRRFRLLDSAFSRWIAGAAHHAIVAFQTVLDHPETFGAAMCFSTSFEGAEGAPPPHSPMLLHLEQRPILPGSVYLYFDYGTIGLDECYEPYHRDLGAILRHKNWFDGVEFVIVRNLGGSQTPSSITSRVASALHWLASR